MNKKEYSAGPFLKWAGGKGRLLHQIFAHLPPELNSGKIEKYFEPFLGGGAVFFELMKRHKFKSVHLYEINPNLSSCYNIIQKNVKELIDELDKLKSEYISTSEKKREKLYYDKREEFNAINCDDKKFAIYHAALLIFLNKTCFNGLYRVNSKGRFNSPFGQYKNPQIYDKNNLLATNNLLQKNVEIHCDDFSQCLSYADGKSLIYFDPPYRPISNTSNFNSYSKNSFDDSEQKRLKCVFDELNKRESFVMLSNSDPKNNNPDDEFFDDLYKDFRIERLITTRLINCNSKLRENKVSEILIMNY